MTPSAPPSRMRIWHYWLAAFYSVWLLLNFGLALWEQTLAHWPIAAAMVLGSYFAGSTPMGGGTVGFPVLVLLFHQPASLGRNFGLAIQSVGLTSASIFILCRRTPIASRILKWGACGSAIGLVAGTVWLVPRLPDALVKLLFASVWMSFGMLTLFKNREICGFRSLPAVPASEARSLGILVGFLGGVTMSLTGVGIEMMLYTLLVLLYRMDLKAAVPTSVILLALSSLMGAAVHLTIGDFDRELFHNWLAAAPVVVLGAPLGAFLLSVIPRIRTLYFVAVLCVLQFVWTLHSVSPSRAQWWFVGGNLIAASIGFTVLYRAGRSRLLPSERTGPRLASRAEA